MAEEIVNQETELLSDADPIIETTPEDKRWRNKRF